MRVWTDGIDLFDVSKESILLFSINTRPRLYGYHHEYGHCQSGDPCAAFRRRRLHQHQHCRTLRNGHEHGRSVGFGYWVTPNVKIAGSYRLDALINVQNQRNAAVANLIPDRYPRGPSAG
jgi:hypothetical protein